MTKININDNSGIQRPQDDGYNPTPALKIIDQFVLDTGTLELHIDDGVEARWFTFEFQDVYKEELKGEWSRYKEVNDLFSCVVVGTYMGELNDLVKVQELSYE